MRTLSRRDFVVMAGAAAAATKLAQAQKGTLTAGEIVSRIKQNLGIPWPDNTDKTFRDTFKIGGPGYGCEWHRNYIWNELPRDGTRQ